MKIIILIVGALAAVAGIGMIMTWWIREKQYYRQRAKEVAGAAMLMLRGVDLFDAAAQAAPSGKRMERPKSSIRVRGVILVVVGCLIILAGLLVK